MKTLLKGLQKTRHHRKGLPPQPTGGFTMIELLVGMIIATLIITPMLTFVVNILDGDVREQAKTNTEQELQTAIDYIAQDMSQAVYVYDAAGVGLIEDELPDPGPTNPAVDDPKEPILVFWKREFVENALAFGGGICANPDTDSCNDTFVLSLVAYYLIDDNNSTWCEPSGGTCPKRIARFQIQDGVKDLSGNYVCDQDSDGDGRSSQCQDDTDLRNFQRDLGFNSFNKDDATGWTKNGSETYSNDAVVLINYAEGFELNSVDNNKLADITIVGNAKRRVPGNFSDLTCSVTDPSPYCPKATARVGARSGYGEQ